MGWLWEMKHVMLEPYLAAYQTALEILLISNVHQEALSPHQFVLVSQAFTLMSHFVIQYVEMVWLPGTKLVMQDHHLGVSLIALGPLNTSHVLREVLHLHQFVHVYQASNWLG